jgi:hypothetical protein
VNGRLTGQVQAVRVLSAHAVTLPNDGAGPR